MSKINQSLGKCAFCGYEETRGKITKHLTTCSTRQELIVENTRKQDTIEDLYHLEVEATGQSEYWLDLEMRGTATLQQLDRYLRAIWLECCGHLSHFSKGGYDGEQVGKKRRASEVFEPKLKLTHIYDYGSSSITLIKVTARRQGAAITSRPITLMARNLPPDQYCIECDQPAACLCMECVIEENRWGALCEAHAPVHRHHNYGDPHPIVNSPRLGVCGPIESDEPPY